MKIKQIDIRNIASLKGNHRINFEELTDHSKTIAITGETGSGKSSILNSIAIALFGKSHKDNFSQTDLVTLGQEEGEVRLYFEFANSNYMATWKCRVRKKNKELLKKPNITRSLIHITDEKEVELDIMPEKLIGLSFEQFTKTIILNQGQFSEFLLSSFSDRKKILETLLSHFDLVDLSVKSKRNLKDIENQLNLIESKVEGLKGQQTLSKDEIQANLKSLNTKLTQVQSLKEQFSDYSETLEDLTKDITHYQNSKQEKNISKEKISKLTTSYNETLVESDKEEVHYSELETRIKSELKELNKTKVQKVELKKIKEQKTQARDQKETQKEQISSKKETKKKFELELIRIKNSLEALSIDEDIKIDQIDFLEQSILEVTELSHGLDLSINKKSSNEKELSDIRQNKAELESSVSALTNQLESTISGSSLDILKGRLDDLNSQKEQINLTIQKQKNKKSELLKIEEDLSKSKKLMDSITDKVNSSKLRLSIIEDAIKADELQIKINELTATSIELQECIICKNQDISNLKIPNKTKKNLYKIELDEAKEEFNELKKSELELKVSIDLLTKTKDETLSTIEDLSKYENQNSNLLNKIKQISQEIEEQTKSIAIKEEISKNLKAQKDKLKKTTEKEKTTNVLLKEINSTIQISQRKIQDNQTKLKALLKGKEFTLNEMRDLINTLKQKENLDIRYSNGLNAVNNLNDEIENIINQLEKNKTQEQHFQNQEKTLTSSIKKEYLDIDIDVQLKLLDNELASKHNKLDRIKKELNDKEIKLAQEQSRYSMLVEQVCAYEALFITNKSRLQSSNDHLLSKLREKVLSLKSINDVDLVLFQESLTEIQNRKNNYTKEFIDLREKVSNQKMLLDQALTTEARIADSLDEINSLTVKRSTAEQLYKLLGKDEFRNYVLSIVEKNLIRSTNHQLHQLCQGRYILEQKLNPVNSTSDYYIIDKLNFSMQRKISTLSGGETFMVSLAMALALSDITRGENVIDNFFIDEGFGTLDHESIDEVLEMLNTIKSQGKTITLISHIKEITSRIPINIQLQKAETGNSIIKTVFQ